MNYTLLRTLPANSRFRNAKSKLPFFKEIIFTKLRLLLGLVLELLEDSSFSRILR
ncbi:Uncharacterised protein [Prevotella intermedia]|nr:Uncharacterised protein [Prevotella intermedia]